MEQLTDLLLWLPAQAKAGGQWQFFIMMGGMILIFYFFIIRPQSKQQKERQTMLNALQKGDKIITTGGIYGTITEVSEHSMRVRVAEGVVLRMSRTAIGGKTTKEDVDKK